MVPSQSSKPYVVVIGGTGAFGLLLTLYYFILAAVCGNAQKVAIPDFGLRSVESSYAKLKVRLDELCPDKSRPLILVGHSQGGFLAMWYFMEHSERVIKVVSICAPLHGSTVSHHHLPMPKSFDQLAADSPFMIGTRRRPGFALRLDVFVASLGDEAKRRIFCVSAKHDELVQPPNSATIEGATGLRVSGLSEHFLTPFNIRVLVSLASFLNADQDREVAEKSVAAAETLATAA